MKIAMLVGVSAAALLVWQAWHRARHPETSRVDDFKRLWGNQEPTAAILYGKPDDAKIRIKGRVDREREAEATRHAKRIAHVRPFRREA